MCRVIGAPPPQFFACCRIMAGQNVSPHNSAIIEMRHGYEAYLAERQRTSKKIFKSTFSKLRKLDRVDPSYKQ